MCNAEQEVETYFDERIRNENAVAQKADDQANMLRERGVFAALGFTAMDIKRLSEHVPSVSLGGREKLVLEVRGELWPTFAQIARLMPVELEWFGGGDRESVAIQVGSLIYRKPSKKGLRWRIMKLVPGSPATAIRGEQPGLAVLWMLVFYYEQFTDYARKHGDWSLWLPGLGYKPEIERKRRIEVAADEAISPFLHFPKSGKVIIGYAHHNNAMPSMLMPRFVPCAMSSK